MVSRTRLFRCQYGPVNYDRLGPQDRLATGGPSSNGTETPIQPVSWPTRAVKIIVPFAADDRPSCSPLDASRSGPPAHTTAHQPCAAGRSHGGDEVAAVSPGAFDCWHQRSEDRSVARKQRCAKRPNRTPELSSSTRGRPAAKARKLGGTGRVHDWQISRRLSKETTRPMMLAGGSDSPNIWGAIATICLEASSFSAASNGRKIFQRPSETSD